MDDVSVQILMARIEDVHTRLDDMVEIQTERHDQNSGNIRSLDADVRHLTRTIDTMNGTVAKHTQDLGTLFGRPTPITLANLKWYIWVFLGGVGTVVGTLTALIAVLHAFRLLPGQ